jgi:hypothetical protein
MLGLAPPCGDNASVTDIVFNKNPEFYKVILWREISSGFEFIFIVQCLVRSPLTVKDLMARLETTLRTSFWSSLERTWMINCLINSSLESREVFFDPVAALFDLNAGKT